MYDNLPLCRAIMRLYSYCELDQQSLKIICNELKDILSEYFRIEPALKSAFDQEGIILYPVAVNSLFENIIKNVLEVFFIYAPVSYNVPEELIRVLYNFLSSYRENISTYNQLNLLWGYSGRYFDKVNNSRLITDGLQCSNGSIIIDIFTYKIASHDCLHHRIVHELLHALGVEESEMELFILPACSVSYDIAKPFLNLLISQVNTIISDFFEKEASVANKNPALSERLITLGNLLYDRGFPVKLDRSLFATTYLPDRLFPKLDSKGYNVLFM